MCHCFMKLKYFEYGELSGWKIKKALNTIISHILLLCN